MRKITSIVNQKGGVGKTTTSINLATIFAIMGKNVLLIDIDSQGNTSSGLGISQKDRVKTSYDLICGLSSPKEVIVKTDIPNLDIIPANTNLATIESKIINQKNHYSILSNAIHSIKNIYDYIIIDCPPALNILTLNALTVSDDVIIPMLCDFYSLEGLSNLLKTINIVQKELNPKIRINGVLLTMYDKRNKLTDLVESDVRSHLKDTVYKTVIPRNVRVAEAPSYGKSVVMYDHNSSGARSYIELAKEIQNRDI